MSNDDYSDDYDDDDGGFASDSAGENPTPAVGSAAASDAGGGGGGGRKASTASGLSGAVFSQAPVYEAGSPTPTPRSSDHEDMRALGAGASGRDSGRSGPDSSNAPSATPAGTASYGSSPAGSEAPSARGYQEGDDQGSEGEEASDGDMEGSEEEEEEEGGSALPSATASTADQDPRSRAGSDFSGVASAVSGAGPSVTTGAGPRSGNGSGNGGDAPGKKSGGGVTVPALVMSPNARGLGLKVGGPSPGPKTKGKKPKAPIVPLPALCSRQVSSTRLVPPLASGARPGVGLGPAAAGPGRPGTGDSAAKRDSTRRRKKAKDPFAKVKQMEEAMKVLQWRKAEIDTQLHRALLVSRQQHESEEVHVTVTKSHEVEARVKWMHDVIQDELDKPLELSRYEAEELAADEERFARACATQVRAQRQLVRRVQELVQRRGHTPGAGAGRPTTSGGSRDGAGGGVDTFRSDGLQATSRSAFDLEQDRADAGSAGAGAASGEEDGSGSGSGSGHGSASSSARARAHVGGAVDKEAEVAAGDHSSRGLENEDGEVDDGGSHSGGQGIGSGASSRRAVPVPSAAQGSRPVTAPDPLSRLAELERQILEAARRGRQRTAGISSLRARRSHSPVAIKP